ncbi:hypothetical protein EWM64_g9014 [Hericium alpestre]|uniref:Uncharacterized protein n=1 Tax=Hericium alpestre TaxID=135208 RepID=A0A4Y9ZL68_9AGAM|nr:hypothetical protein EWM64_g9014 [Hericium alpestre]
MPKAEFINDPFQFSVAQNRCEPFVPPTRLNEFKYPCLIQPTRGSWGYGIQALTPGMQVMSNSSSTLQTITLADENDLAVFVDPSAPANISFVATSFGARTTCESVNHLCTDPNDMNVTCTGFPPTFPPVNVSAPDTAIGMGPGMSQLAVLSSGCDGCNHLSSSNYSTGQVSYNSTGPFPENNYSLWLTLLWEGQGSVTFDGGSDDPNRDVAYTVFATRAYILANCTMQFFNVTLGYENGAYRLLNAELSNSGLSDGLAGPTRAGLYDSRLLDDVQGIAFSGNSTADVMAYLNQDLARLALGSAAYVTDLKGPTLTQSRLGQRILGRYPVAPALVYIIVLWSNAVFPLVVAAVAMASRTTYVGVPGRGRAVTALELAKVRLTRPAALVAELFWWSKDGEYHRAKASASADVAGMFEEQRTEGRVKIGLHERVDGQTVFGVWTRRRNAGEKEAN